MPALPGPDRLLITKKFMHEISDIRQVVNLTKADLQAAVNAIDDWIDGNAAAFNASLPLPARTVLTAAQKARLFSLVAQRRYEVT